MVRIFIAVEPSAEIQHNLGASARSLLGTTARLTPVDASLMHITLRFLGETPAAEIPALITALRSIRASPYEMTVSGVSTFGRPPRVIKAEVSDGGATAALAGQIDDRLYALGIPKDQKPFSPHLTLARVREYAPDLLPRIALMRGTVFGTCTISGVMLKKSTLTPSGPIYETIAEVTL